MYWFFLKTNQFNNIGMYNKYLYYLSESIQQSPIQQQIRYMKSEKTYEGVYCIMSMMND